MQAVERAAVNPDGYFVVTRQRAPERPRTAAAPVEDEAAPLEPFASVVKKKLEATRAPEEAH